MAGGTKFVTVRIAGGALVTEPSRLATTTVKPVPESLV